VPAGKSRPQPKQKPQEEFDPGEEDFDPGDVDDKPVAQKKPAGGARVASASTADPKKKVVPAVKRDGSPDKPLPEDEQPLTNLNSPLVFEGAGITFKKGRVAATVNGQPIFVEDVLRQVPHDQALRLEQAKVLLAQQQLSQDDFNELQRTIVEMNLKSNIERELLLQALKTKIKDDVLKNIQKQIDASYDSEYLPQMMKLANVKTEAEFDERLRKEDSSLETLRSQYRNNQMAQQFLASKATPKSSFDRPDILRYYQEHKEDYAIRAQAKWEQINLKFASNGGPEATRRKAKKLLQRLDAGEDFAVIAKEFSNGPMASKGGNRGWTTAGSLANKGIEQALYELPLGEISDLIESKDAIDIVRVVDRTESGYQSFAAVQEDIKTHLKMQAWQKATKALLEDLQEKATIEKFIDKL
jgi:parvulin-like peptidyl-prolyl isomerase